MASNPFLALAVMTEQTDISDGIQVVLGTVTSLSPMAVMAFGVAFSGAMLKVNDQILDTYQPAVTLTDADGVSTAYKTLETTDGALAVGDTVFCIADGGRCLYALARMV